MADLIGFPFRQTPTGAIYKRPDGSEACYTEELALLCLTRPGERELVPTFGLSDPSFDDFDQIELVSKVRLFLPDITITTIDSSFPKNGEHRLVIEYESELIEQGSEELDV